MILDVEIFLPLVLDVALPPIVRLLADVCRIVLVADEGSLYVLSARLLTVHEVGDPIPWKVGDKLGLLPLQ